jgi:hypothetical protein
MEAELFFQARPKRRWVIFLVSLREAGFIL